jgi:phosphoribosylglycinamide formyltransferase-1
MKNIVILISGRGSNSRRQGSGDRPRPRHFDRRGGRMPSMLRASCFDAALAAEIDRHAPDLVVLAGFMRILGEAFRAALPRPPDEHPSLAAAGLSPACTPTGAPSKPAAASTACTVHFVTPALDKRPPSSSRAAVPVYPDDSEKRARRPRARPGAHRLPAGGALARRGAG